MIKIRRVQISKIINAPLSDCFKWFYHSENFTASPIVFKSKWTKDKHAPGSERDIIMVAGWYHEQITTVRPNSYIRYRVQRSIPKVTQDFTEINFKKINPEQTKVTWIIEVGMPTWTLTKIACKMAKTLYATILTAGKKQLEMRF